MLGHDLYMHEHMYTHKHTHIFKKELKINKCKLLCKHKVHLVIELVECLVFGSSNSPLKMAKWATRYRAGKGTLEPVYIILNDILAINVSR